MRITHPWGVQHCWQLFLAALGYMTTQDVAETCHQALLAADIAVSGWQYKVVDA
jgi:hypothetical protein